MSVEAKKQPIVHPGEILVDILENNGITQSGLARHIGIAHSYINDICRCRRGISAVTAIKLARAFGQTPDFWLGLQKNWELSQVGNAKGLDIAPMKLRA